MNLIGVVTFANGGGEIAVTHDEPSGFVHLELSDGVDEFGFDLSPFELVGLHSLIVAIFETAET